MNAIAAVSGPETSGFNLLARSDRALAGLPGMLAAGRSEVHTDSPVRDAATRNHMPGAIRAPDAFGTARTAGDQRLPSRHGDRSAMSGQERPMFAQALRPHVSSLQCADGKDLWNPRHIDSS